MVKELRMNGTYEITNYYKLYLYTTGKYLVSSKKKFCDWLSEPKIISVRDSFFRKIISIVYHLSSIVKIDQSQSSII